MSDTSQGPGWWLASDGRWYPPEQHPGYTPVPPPVPPSPPAPTVESPYGIPMGQSPYGIPMGQSPYGPAWWPGQAAPPITSGLAITALVLSVLWIGGLGSVLAVIFGIVALSQIRSSSGQKRGKALATSGLVIGALGLVAAVALYSSGTVAIDQSPASSLSAPSSTDVFAPQLVPASSDVLRRLTNVPPGVTDQVGVPSQSIVTPPSVQRGQPRLVVGGQPGAVFIGGVFCPYCASERWAIIMAFSRFGSFSNLHETTSSPWDVYPSTATFSFHGATYSSRYVRLVMSEHSGNDVDGPGTEPLLDPLTKQEADLWQRYDDSSGYPFLDIGNQAFVLSPSFSPSLLSGFDQSDIASRLADPNHPSTQAIVGTANYLTAAICATTGQTPLSVCATPLVVKAARAMALKGGERLTRDTRSGRRLFGSSLIEQTDGSAQEASVQRSAASAR